MKNQWSTITFSNGLTMFCCLFLLLSSSIPQRVAAEGISPCQHLDVSTYTLFPFWKSAASVQKGYYKWIRNLFKLSLNNYKAILDTPLDLISAEKGKKLVLGEEEEELNENRWRRVAPGRAFSPLDGSREVPEWRNVSLFYSRTFCWYRRASKHRFRFHQQTFDVIEFNFNFISVEKKQDIFSRPIISNM